MPFCTVRCGYCDFNTYTGRDLGGGASQVSYADTVLGGVTVAPFGSAKAGFEGRAMINRRDWGLTWNAAMETGGVQVGDKITPVPEAEADR